MDRAAALSLLPHPLPVALALFDRQGQRIESNAEADRLFASELAERLLPALPALVRQLLQAPERPLRWTLQSAQGAFDCSAVALLEGPNFAGFSLCVAPADAGSRAWQSERASDFATVAGVDLWEWDILRDRVRYTPRGQSQPIEQAVASYLERVHPDDRQGWQARVTAFLNSGQTELSQEFRVEQGAGCWLWVLARGRVVAWLPDGRPQRMLGVHFDIDALKHLEAQLSDRETLLAEAERLGDTGVWAWDPQRQQLWCSQGLARIAGLEGGGLPASPDDLLELVSEPQRPSFRRALAGLRMGGKDYDLELDLQRPDGSLRRVQSRATAVRGELGHIERLLGVLHDVSERVAREESERIRNDMLDRVAQVGHIGGWELNLVTGELMWTEENYRIHGIAFGQKVSVENTRGMYKGHSREVFEAAFGRMLRGERSEDTIEVEFITPEEERVWLRITGRMELRDGKPYRITGMTRDITAEREASERIEQLAHYDSLTGLPNRFQFRELAARAIQQAHHAEGVLALCFLDLDRFKYVNDTLGHEAGDQLLLDVAGRLRAAVRSGDVVARQSGDEFLILLRDLKRWEDAGKVARKMIESINQPIHLGDTEVNVGCSIGIALLSDTNPTLEQLMRAADTAMYAAKEGGRNNFQYYSDAFYERVQRKLTLESELRQALPRGELSLAFQPTIGLSDGRLRGIETLLRWTRAGGEPCSPAEFIPIAEDCGEIVRIGLWVIDQACRQARRWEADGLVFDRIAVNVSAIQLRDSGFAAQVIELCDATGWPTERLELELTESALMRDSDVLRRAFALFEAHGVSLSVDDFGTGFSNLHYLHRFPVQHLKIDRSFVMHLLDDAQIGRLNEAIVSLGHALHLKVVAEGVETEAAVERLRELGCDEAQGFLFTRPLAADQLAAWARQWEAELR